MRGHLLLRVLSSRAITVRTQALLPWTWLGIAYWWEVEHKSLVLLCFCKRPAAFAFALLNCFCLDPWVFLHLVSTLSPAEEGSKKSGVIWHPAAVQGQPTTPHYSSTGSLSFWKSSHSMYIQESSVLHWGYYDFLYVRRIRMIHLLSSFSSVNHQSLCQ